MTRTVSSIGRRAMTLLLLLLFCFAPSAQASDPVRDLAVAKISASTPSTPAVESTPAPVTHPTRARDATSQGAAAAGLALLVVLITYWAGGFGALPVREWLADQEARQSRTRQRPRATIIVRMPVGRRRS